MTNMCEILMKEYGVTKEYAEIIMQMPIMNAIIVLAEIKEEKIKKDGDLKYSSTTLKG